MTYKEKLEKIRRLMEQVCYNPKKCNVWCAFKKDFKCRLYPILWEEEGNEIEVS